MSSENRIYFSPSLLSFIPEKWKSDGTYSESSWPKDARILSDEISGKYWKANPPTGKKLSSANGLPVWATCDPIVHTHSDTEHSRLKAYSDPIQGSDRMFAEAARMQIMGEDGADEVKSKAVARYREIQAQYPWPTK